MKNNYLKIALWGTMAMAACSEDKKGNACENPTNITMPASIKGTSFSPSVDEVKAKVNECCIPTITFDRAKDTINTQAQVKLFNDSRADLDKVDGKVNFKGNIMIGNVVTSDDSARIVKAGVTPIRIATTPVVNPDDNTNQPPIVNPDDNTNQPPVVNPDDNTNQPPVVNPDQGECEGLAGQLAANADSLKNVGDSVANRENYLTTINGVLGTIFSNNKQLAYENASNILGHPLASAADSADLNRRSAVNSGVAAGDQGLGQGAVDWFNVLAAFYQTQLNTLNNKTAIIQKQTEKGCNN